MTIKGGIDFEKLLKSMHSFNIQKTQSFLLHILNILVTKI